MNGKLDLDLDVPPHRTRPWLEWGYWRTQRVDVPLFQLHDFEVTFAVWDNHFEAKDVLSYRAQEFMKRVKAGGEPFKTATDLGTSPQAIKKSRPEIQAEILDMINTYGAMPKEARRAHVRAVQTKIMLDNVNSADVKRQKLALEASIAIGEDEEVGVYPRAVKTAPVAQPGPSLPPIPAHMAKLLEAVELPTLPEPEEENK